MPLSPCIDTIQNPLLHEPHLIPPTARPAGWQPARLAHHHARPDHLERQRGQRLAQRRQLVQRPARHRQHPRHRERRRCREFDPECHRERWHLQSSCAYRKRCSGHPQYFRRFGFGIRHLGNRQPVSERKHSALRPRRGEPDRWQCDRRATSDAPAGRPELTTERIQPERWHAYGRFAENCQRKQFRRCGRHLPPNRWRIECEWQS